MTPAASLSECCTARRPGTTCAGVELLCAYDVAFRGGVDTDDTDLTDDWDAPGFDVATSTLVLQDGDRVVGYATVVEEHTAATVAADRPELLAPLLSWVEQHPAHLEHYVPDPDTARTAVMAARGWVAARRYWRMRRELDSPSPPPAWPAGVRVRDDDRPGDDAAVHALITTCFREIGGQHERTLAAWSTHLLDSPRFDAALYLVAEAGGQVVGAALTQDVGDYGYVRQHAVAPALRGRGVGLALLHEAFGCHRARGLPATMLGVDAANPTGALALYERAGLRVVEHTRWDRPALRPAPDA